MKLSFVRLQALVELCDPLDPVCLQSDDCKHLVAAKCFPQRFSTKCMQMSVCRRLFQAIFFFSQVHTTNMSAARCLHPYIFSHTSTTNMCASRCLQPDIYNQTFAAKCFSHMFFSQICATKCLQLNVYNLLAIFCYNLRTASSVVCSQ